MNEPGRDDDSKHRSIRVRILVLGFVATVALLNVGRGNPVVQGPDDNYWATHHEGCTEVSWGWPFAVYTEYPRGFVSPYNPLAWDCEPIYHRWHSPGLICNLAILLGGTYIIILVARRKAEDSEE